MPFLGILFLVVVLLAFPIKFIHSSNFPIFKKILNKCFLPHCLACGILASNQGSNPPPLHWRHSLNHWIVKEVLIFIFPSLITHLQPQWWIKRETESGGQNCIVLFFSLLLIAFNPCIYLLVFIYPFQCWLNTFNLEYCVPGPLLSLLLVLFKFTDKLKLREVTQLGQSHTVLGVIGLVNSVAHVLNSYTFLSSKIGDVVKHWVVSQGEMG